MALDVAARFADKLSPLEIISSEHSSSTKRRRRRPLAFPEDLVLLPVRGGWYSMWVQMGGLDGISLGISLGASLRINPKLGASLGAVESRIVGVSFVMGYKDSPPPSLPSITDSETDIVIKRKVRRKKRNKVFDGIMVRVRYKIDKAADAIIIHGKWNVLSKAFKIVGESNGSTSWTSRHSTPKERQLCSIRSTMSWSESPNNRCSSLRFQYSFIVHLSLTTKHTAHSTHMVFEKLGTLLPSSPWKPNAGKNLERGAPGSSFLFSLNESSRESQRKHSVHAHVGCGENADTGSHGHSQFAWQKSLGLARKSKHSKTWRTNNQAWRDVPSHTV